jgi:hypothetical protein
MKRLAQMISCVALAATIVPPLLFFTDKLDLAQAQFLMLASAIAWFTSAPFWMERKASD